ncbi:hypothetical protein [Salinisphaera sp. G21_0]|uniref:hypothetical protein n=1 Tax=Salinisphaera sp. G21_0 TaxID=2821094 RepID=UPI001ADB0E7A|nr:hypothetical protein [Salinisphaera sp. G21_0]MBO9481662.1 hypothetical protein [Salinisphaera sp. G21_0]
MSHIQAHIILQFSWVVTADTAIAVMVVVTLAAAAVMVVDAVVSERIPQISTLTDRGTLICMQM